MKSNWIDFKELRSKLHFSELFQHYRVELKIKGDQATGFCPLPCHPRHEGKRHSPSFSANLARGLFNCFGCGRKGNCLDFICFMEGADPTDAQALRRVAILASEHLGLGSGITGKTVAKPVDPKPQITPQPESLQPEKPRIINAPIDFELKTLQADHPYLAGRGFTAETIRHFGLGFCSRGLMAGRIAIPLHDAVGKLIGYAGRLVDDAQISDETPRYRFPGGRERDGVIYEFRKSLFLYNGHAITAGVKDLIIVEGFASVWWLWQHGYHNVVALMGSSCSGEQAEMIAKLVVMDGHVWVFPDGDDAGDRCAESLFSEVGKRRFIRWLSLNVRQQPTDCGARSLLFLLPPDCLEKQEADASDIGQRVQ